MVQGLESLLLAAEPGITNYWDAGVAGVLGGVIVLLWNRCKNLEERSHADLKESLEALHASASALKDVAKTVERLEQRIREVS